MRRTPRPDPFDVYGRASRMWGAKRFREAAELVATLLPHYSAEALNGHPYHELWWMFCEDVADAIAAGDPDLARELYELAIMSHYKEGSEATGSGEGINVMRNIEAIRKKIDALPGHST